MRLGAVRSGLEVSGMSKRAHPLHKVVIELRAKVRKDGPGEAVSEGNLLEQELSYLPGGVGLQRSGFGILGEVIDGQHKVLVATKVGRLHVQDID
jgi:hypothetical protein